MRHSNKEHTMSRNRGLAQTLHIILLLTWGGGGDTLQSSGKTKVLIRKVCFAG